MKRFSLLLTLTALAAAPLHADPTPAAPALTVSTPPAAAVPTAPVDLAAPTLPPIPAHRPLRVAIYQGPGAAADALHSLPAAALTQDPDVTLTAVSAADIQAGKLAGFDALVQPGGSGGGQGRALGESGRDRIRSFVRGGGGFIGICGGSYLASDDYPWSLGLINARVLDKKHWARGHGPVKITLSAEGEKRLAAPVASLPIIYWQGPLLAPGQDSQLPAYQPWATFQTEIAEHGAPAGVMTGATAIAAAPYGHGRVVCFSPHPEKTLGEAPLLHRALVWVTETSSAAR